MPCKDTTALMTVRVDPDDRLLGYDYAKMTCSKTIGEGQSFQQYCLGKAIQEISRWPFDRVLQDLHLENEDTESQFLVYLEWSALRSALIQYLGGDEDVDSRHFEMASVEHTEQGVRITQVIRPNSDMPKIESCFKRSLNVSR